MAAAKLVSAPANLYVGTSGWAYPTWRPGFYPAALSPKAFLHHYGAHFTSVEVNYTFRQLCEDEQLRGWLAATPPGFRFSFKIPQSITHYKRLLACNDALAEFFAHLQPVRDAGKMGAVLFQLPPNFKFSPDRLRDLLAAPSVVSTSHELAFEFRHASWFNEETYSLLRGGNAAMCIAESEDLTTPAVQTATHSYFRLRCPGAYQPKQLKAHAGQLTALAADRHVYAYYKHEDEPTGAINALATLRAARTLDRKPAA